MSGSPGEGGEPPAGEGGAGAEREEEFHLDLDEEDRASNARRRRIATVVAVSTAAAAVLTGIGTVLMGYYPYSHDDRSAARTAPTSGPDQVIPSLSPSPKPTAPPTTPPATPKKPDTCSAPHVVGNVQADFISPCTYGEGKAPYPHVKLKVRYPPQGSTRGQIYIVATILGNGSGAPLADKPMYGEYPVTEEWADKSTETTWEKNLFVYQSCRDHGQALLQTYLLDKQGVAAAKKWQQGRTISIPPHSTLLDEVRINVVANSTNC